MSASGFDIDNRFYSSNLDIELGGNFGVIVIGKTIPRGSDVAIGQAIPMGEVGGIEPNLTFGH